MTLPVTGDGCHDARRDRPGPHDGTRDHLSDHCGVAQRALPRDPLARDDPHPDPRPRSRDGADNDPNPTPDPTHGCRVNPRIR